MFRPRLEVEADGGGGGGACYVTGTQLASPTGAISIEDLSVGAMVLTVTGEARPVQWLGHRTVNCKNAPNPNAVWPIRIDANAFADGQPSRDLWISPGHSVLIDGVLIQAERLLNGATISQVPTEKVQYWHVELESHGVLVAENLPAESYLDTGNRASFANGGDFVEAHPDFKPRHSADTCAPLVQEGPEVERIKARLLERARGFGHASTTDADVHLFASGNRIEPLSLGPDRQAFVLPAQCAAIELRSRQFVPAHMTPANYDMRLLGVSVKRLQIDGADVPLDQDGLFLDGWHVLETDSAKDARWRWTTGRAVMPAGCRLVVIDLNPWGIYWQSAPASSQAERLAGLG
jgi:hypothetical protein